MKLKKIYGKIKTVLYRRLVFIAWLIAGILCLTSEVDKFDYALCWIALLLFVWFKFPLGNDQNS